MLSLDEIRELGSEDTNLRYVLLKVCLQQALQGITDAPEWLELVEAGYSPTQAASKLGHNRKWLEEVRSACRRALYQPSPPHN